ncbi:hypothetical protein J6590_044194 [Homalodisca vitripennis]|nr:hypothetical protein J6590_044194 [Homalodisca vitripennis]
MYAERLAKPLSLAPVAEVNPILSPCTHDNYRMGLTLGVKLRLYYFHIDIENNVSALGVAMPACRVLLF